MNVFAGGHRTPQLLSLSSPALTLGVVYRIDSISREVPSDSTKLRFGPVEPNLGQRAIADRYRSADFFTASCAPVETTHPGTAP
jgi:hypothetical protein